jgi:hypothetical protein
MLTYEGVSKSFRTGRLERELQMVQLSATRCSYIAILWVSLVSFVAIIICVAFQRVFTVVAYFVIDSVWKLLDSPSYLAASIFNLNVEAAPMDLDMNLHHRANRKSRMLTLCKCIFRYLFQWLRYRYWRQWRWNVQHLLHSEGRRWLHSECEIWRPTCTRWLLYFHGKCDDSTVDY